MDTTIQRTILRSLFYNEDYVRQVLPFLKAEYFQEQNERRLFKEVAEFIGKYNKPPTVEAVSVNLGNADDVRSQEALDTMKGILDQIEQNRDQKVEMKWLVDESEKFCKDQALYNAIMDSIQILDGKGKNKTLQKTAIPEIVSKALSVSFDNRIGHDYLEDYENRYEMYHRKEEKVQFHLQSLNRITRGGIGKKTLNILLAGTNVGKSIFMCDFAAHSLKQGLNVLYITCEMAEERIGERIDMNLLDLNTDDLYTIPKETYEKKLQKIKQATKGRLYVKEYPTAAAHVGHFKFLLDELKLKKNFVPDIVFLDYLNICASIRYNLNANVNSYTYVKSIAEEVRGLSIEYNVPIFTATQTTRQGYSSSDVDLTDVSESFGVAQNSDLMIAFIASEELDELNQIMVKQLKNRYNDKVQNRKFLIGIDRSKMKFYDLEDSISQRGLVSAGSSPPPSSTNSGTLPFNESDDIDNSVPEEHSFGINKSKNTPSTFSEWKIS